MKSQFWLRVARWYVQWKVGRSLDGVFVGGLAEIKALQRDHALLFAANHVSWWDGLLLVLLDRALDSDGYVLMDAANLSQLPFFNYLGALPLNRSRPAAMRHGLKKAIQILEKPGKSLWIFPQGKQRPAHLRPLGLLPGFQFLLRNTKALLIPVALNYGFREDHRFSAWISFGRPCTADQLESHLVGELEAIDREMIQEGNFSPLMGVHGRRLDRGMGSQILAWISREKK